MHSNRIRYLNPLLIAVTVGLILGVAAAPSDVVATVTARRDDTFARIDLFVEEQMARHRIPGLALVITKGAEVVHARGYGSAGAGRPVTSETPFYIGSISKSFTAVAVMQLVEQGHIDLDTPVQRYLPWFEVADPEVSRTITVRHLLHQTSGLSESSYWLDLPETATMEDVVRDMARATPMDRPGTAFHYFNQNYTILGLLVEEVSGQPFGSYVRREILEPLSMDRSAATPAGRTSLEITPGHGVLFGFPIEREQTIAASGMPSGGIVSTAEDMGHYLVAQMNGGRYDGNSILPAERVAQLHRPDTPGAPEGEGYAMGWIVEPREGVVTIRHGGSLENFRAFAWLLPEEDYAFAILMNQNGFLPSTIAYSAIPEGVADLLVGRRPASGIAMKTVYWALTGLFLVMIATDLRWWLVKLPAWRKRAADSPPVRLIATIGAHLISAGLLFAVPNIILTGVLDRGFTWSLGFSMAPTLMLMVVWGMLMGLEKAVMLTVVALRSR
jgi:CubicO group peptidase (beta-lactamase class C family)